MSYHDPDFEDLEIAGVFIFSILACIVFVSLALVAR